MATVILYGPQGSGKTSWVERLKKAHGISNVVEEWQPYNGLTTGALHVTSADRYELGAYYFRADDLNRPVFMYPVESLKALFPEGTN